MLEFFATRLTINRDPCHRRRPIGAIVMEHSHDQAARNPSDRREFLKSGVLAAAGGSLLAAGVAKAAGAGEQVDRTQALGHSAAAVRQDGPQAAGAGHGRFGVREGVQRRLRRAAVVDGRARGHGSPRLRRRHSLFRHRPRLRRKRTDRRQGAQGRARELLHRHQVPHHRSQARPARRSKNRSPSWAWTTSTACRSTARASRRSASTAP